MVGELSAVGRKLEKLLDADVVARMAEAGGQAGKKSALKAASRDAGGDRRLSGMRRKAALNAGYDVAGDGVVINFRPAGLWVLLSGGRRKAGTILPRRRGGKRAVTTPDGPRASSSFRPTAGKGTYDDAVQDMSTEVPKAAFRKFEQEVGRAIRG